jgi:hypothetical protein
MHRPLSQRLARILKQKAPSGGVTMNYLLDRTEGRRLHPLMILLCLPSIERCSQPRRTKWMSWPLAHPANVLLIALLALLVALPLPSAPFFPTNGPPAYAIILIAAAMMEQDGVLTWFGYAKALATLIFFGSIAGMIVQLFTAVCQFFINR